MCSIAGAAGIRWSITVQRKQLSLTPFIRGAARAGARRTRAYEWAAEGLIPPPIHVGRNAYLAEHEVEAVIAARLAGKTEAEVREVVRDLIAQRTTSAAGAA